MTMVKKKIIRNSKNGKKAENDKNSQNTENAKYLETNLAQVSYIQYPITF